MEGLQKIIEDIEALRTNLHELMGKSDDLLDKEIILASKMLDAVLNEYYHVICSKESESL